VSGENGAAYSLYELFRVLIERVGWRSEAERVAALESVNLAESMGIFGNLAQMMKCPHERKSYPARGVVNCLDCGRRLE